MGADVAMISKVHPVRSHSNAAQGGINGPGVGEDGGPWEEHAYETTKASDYLGDQDAITILAQEGGREVLQAEHWGVVFSRKPDGHMAVRAFGGMAKARTFFVGAITGQAILHVLYEQLMKPSVFQAMRNYEEWFVTSLIIDRRPVPRRSRDEHPHRRPARDHGEGDDHLHRRPRAGLRAIDQRADLHRRWHRAGVPRGRADHGYGDGADPPDDAQGHGRADHRGRAR